MADMTAPSLATNLDRVTRISIQSKPLKANGEYGSPVEIGMVESINPSENRDVSSHYTLGGNAEEPKVLVPGLVGGRTLTVKALALWKQTIIGQFSSLDTFMYSLVQQQQPFDVVVTRKKADKSESYALTYSDCYVQSWSYDQDISKGSSVLIVENAVIVYRTVSSN